MRDQEYSDDMDTDELTGFDDMHRPFSKKVSKKALRMMRARKAIEDHYEQKQLDDDVNDVWLDED